MRRIEPHINSASEQLAPVHVVILDVNHRNSFLQRRRSFVDFADQPLALFVAGMRFSAIDHLKRAIALANGAQAIEIAEKQIGALIRGGTSRESQNHRSLVEFCSGSALDFRQHQALSSQMRFLNFFEADANRMPQIQIFSPPLRDAPVKQFLEWRGSPSGSMNAVGDGMNRIFREHLLRYFAV